MNRKSVIILGAVLFLLLAVICLFNHARKIENKLIAQSLETLNMAGFVGIDVSFNGRDAIVTGQIVSQELLDKATDLIKKINGVRSVNNKLTVVTPLNKEAVDKTATTPAEEELTQSKVDLTKLLSGLYVKFDANSNEPASGQTGVLAHVASLLKEHTSLRIQIIGHTDGKGSQEYNQELSLRRAESVKNYLITNGIAADRFSIKGYGEAKPIADNSTSEGMATNRRVEFNVVEEE